MGFFGICTEQVEVALNTLDAHIRRRLRALELRQCKRKRTHREKAGSVGEQTQDVEAQRPI
jgi:hypothetical protein